MTESSAIALCPWCSAETTPGRPTCPSCGANLVETGEPAVPGLTAIDAEAVLRSVRAASAPPRRSRFLSLITGEDADEPSPPGSEAALAPPPPEVRREMLRIELAAQLADATAEVEALAADGAVEQPAATASPDAASPDAASPAAGRPANAVEADSPPAQSPG